VSDGCRNCYAERVAARFSKPGQPYHGLAEMRNGKPHWTGTARMVPEHLVDPLRWTRQRRIFVNSMSDLFHSDLTNEDIAAVFGVMAAARRHTFQVLTKRPERMQEWFTWAEQAMSGRYRVPALIGHAAAWVVERVGRNAESDLLHKHAAISAGIDDWPLPNVWLGVSVENQEACDLRVPYLLEVPAAVRFLSCEPLLGPVTFRWAAWVPWTPPGGKTGHLDGLKGIDWVIGGGESGPGSRPMHPYWARQLRDECAKAGVPFHFKQWGEWVAGDQIQRDGFCIRDEYDFPDGTRVCRIGKKDAGRHLDGVIHDAMPRGYGAEVPACPQ
jgi:protein gp37